MDPKTLDALIELEDTYQAHVRTPAGGERAPCVQGNMLQALRTAELKDYEEMVTQLRTLCVEFDIYVQQTQR